MISDHNKLSICISNVDINRSIYNKIDIDVNLIGDNLIGDN